MKANKEVHKFWEDLFKKEMEHISVSSYAIFSGDNLETPPHLGSILGLRKDQLSSIAGEALDALENMGSIQTDGWNQFKWRVWAFLEIQDVFDASFHDHCEDLIYFRLWYFYFESKYILLESLLAGLNGLYQSSQTLLRPFLEFSVLQNYYYRTTNKSRSYLEVKKWLENGQSPRWAKTLKGCLDQSVFSDPIRTRINYHYVALSNNFAHPYHQDFSPKKVSKSSIPGHSAVGLMSMWRMIDLVLEGVLWMYFSNFPMLLQPKDITSKFGFNGPLGLFVDSSSGYIFKKSLSDNTLSSFQLFSDSNSDVVSLLEWFEAQPNLTFDEIKATWNTEEDGPFPDDINSAKTKKFAKMRALREAMSLNSMIEEKNDSGIDLDRIDLSYKGWEKIHLKKKGKH